MSRENPILLEVDSIEKEGEYVRTYTTTCDDKVVFADKPAACLDAAKC